MRSGYEEISEALESGSQIRLKNAIVRRRLAPPSKCRIAKKDSLCSNVDRSRAFLGRAFDEGNALASSRSFPI